MYDIISVYILHLGIYLTLVEIFVLLAYYHSIGERICAEWKAVYEEKEEKSCESVSSCCDDCMPDTDWKGI